MLTPTPKSDDDAAVLPDVLAYYKMAGRVIEANFGGDPIVYVNFPHGFGEGKAYYNITDLALTADNLLWLIHHKYAIEFQGWAPLATDEDRLRFARLLITGGTSFERRRIGTARMRDHLREDGLDAAVVLDGCGGFALWIPFADAPHAAAARAWLHRLCNRAVAADPDLFSTEPNTHDPTRVHLHIQSNARHHYSALPYSLRGTPELPMVTPTLWDIVADAESAKYEQVYAENFVEYMQGCGDLFSREVHRIGEQRLPATPAPQFVVPDLESLDSATRGRVITATIAILEDGKARTAEEILDEALELKLVPPTTTKKYIYSALIEYIARWLGRGRKPQIIQDADREFRINEPPDDWPDITPRGTRGADVTPSGARGPDVTPSGARGAGGVEGQPGHGDAAEPEEQVAIDALIGRLDAASTGNDPAAFEIACCDVFAHLGFRTQHLGGHADPDGIADAILGPLAYRMMLECKSAPLHRPYHPHRPGQSDSGGIVERPDVAEAAKFVTAFEADYAALIAPDYGNDLETLSELKTHKVTAFTVADLATLLHLDANALEICTVLDEPGFAMEKIADLVWERHHGRVKRIATVAALIQRAGWSAQRTASEQYVTLSGATVGSEVEGPLTAWRSNGDQLHAANSRLDRGDAPRLTVDAAMLLVDEALRAAGSTQACTREEVETAFAHLTDPLVGAATWLDSSRTAIAILIDPDPVN